MKRFNALLALGLFCLAPVTFAATLPVHQEHASDAIAIHHPTLTMNAKHPGRGTISMEMVNVGSHSHTLVGAVSPAAPITTLTQASLGSGKPIYQLKSVTVQPKAHFDFAANGTSLTMHKINPASTQSKQIPLTLVFDDGSNMQVQANVVG